MSDKPHEIRMAKLEDGREVLDEVCTDAAFVHFEVMDDDHLWCGLTLPDGRSLHVNISAINRGGRHPHIVWRVSEDWPGGKEYADAD